MGEMLPRAQLIGPGVRSVLGGLMEEVSTQEALARGENSLLMLEVGVDDVNVLSTRKRLPWMWEAGGYCVLGARWPHCAVTRAVVTMTTC